MDRMCSMNSGDEKRMQRVGYPNLKVKNCVNPSLLGG